MLPVADNSRRARLVIVFFWVLLAVYCIEGVASFVFVQIEEVSTDRSFLYTAFAWVVSLLSMMLLSLEIAQIVVFLMWFYQAYDNLKRAGYQNNYSSGWAVGLWFVPLFNLFIPYQIMKEIWYKTQHEYTTELEEHGWVRSWWVLFLCSTISFQFTNSNPETMLRKETAMLVVAGLKIASILISIALVKKIAFFEEGFLTQVRTATIGKSVETEPDAAEEELY